METPVTLEEKKCDISQIENQFHKFLNENRIKKGTKGNPTHTGVGKHAGSFVIEGNQLKPFYNLYRKLMQRKCEINLIERHSEFGPILIDIDMRFPPDMKKRIFNFGFVKKICKEYITLIQTYFDVPESQIQAFVFERPEPYPDKDLIKDGIHIMFPFIISEPTVQHIIRDEAIKLLEEEFKKIPLTNNIYNAIDKAVIEANGWYMYGSTKPGVSRYNLRYIFDSNLTQIDIKTYDEFDLPEILSIRGKNDTSPIRESKIEEVNNMKLKNTIKKQSKKKENAELTQDEIQSIYELVSLLSTSRADEYEDWRNVGLALHSIDSESEDLLNIWNEFSQKSDKYEKGACEDFWQKFKLKSDGGNLSIGSLHYWAKLDNPVEYQEYKNSQTRVYIEDSISGTHVDVAKVLYRMYKYQWVFCNPKSQNWYHFDKHRWEEDECGIKLRSKISNELLEEYTKTISYLNEKIINIENTLEEEADKKKRLQMENKMKEISNKIEKLFAITNKIKSTPFIDNVMKECRGLFFDKNFLKKLDENHYLFSFKNGVLELETGVFRNGRPDDFLSFCCGVNYIPFSDKLPYLKEVREFLSQVQPKPELRQYMLDLLCSLLEGHNADESFHLWTGTGGNGKSKINELLVLALEDYALKLPITLLTGKRAASNAVSPEVVETKGKRFVYMEEPSDGERINIGLMKEFTGGDKIKGRGLFQGTTEFKPQFKMILYCNDMPKVNAEDDGTWRRIKVLEFRSKFKDNPDPKDENQFPIDRYLSDKLPKWKETFMAIIVNNYFTKYKKDGKLIIPTEISNYTEEYQKDNDNYIEFISTKLIKTDNKNNKIPMADVHNAFKTWFFETYNHQKFPVKRDMKKHFEKKYGKDSCTLNDLIGFIWKTEDEDD